MLSANAVSRATQFYPKQLVAPAGSPRTQEALPKQGILWEEEKKGGISFAYRSCAY